MIEKKNSLYVEEMQTERNYILYKYTNQRIKAFIYKIKLLIIKKKIRSGYK